MYIYTCTLFFLYIVYIIYISIYVCVCVYVSKCSFIYVYNNPAPVIRAMQFHYCTVSNPGTGADDAFFFEALRVAERHMAFTQTTGDSRQCEPFSNLFSPLIF